MRNQTVSEISAEISTLQSKLGLLRNEIHRTKDPIDEVSMKRDLEEIENKIDNLQRMYQRSKAVN